MSGFRNFFRIGHSARKRHIPQSHSAVLKAGITHSWWVVVVSTGGKLRRETFLKSRRQDTKRPLQFSALSLTSRGGVKRLESDTRWRHLRPHRSRFFQYCHWLQRIDAQAEGCHRKRSVRSLRLIGLCPNPRFTHERFSKESGAMLSRIKEKSDASGNTLLAKTRIQRSCRSSV